MAPSERVLQKIAKKTIYTDEPENPLCNEEFEGIENMPQWQNIESLQFINTVLLTNLPPLPKKIRALTLTNTAVNSLPHFPKSLVDLNLTKNLSLMPPNKLSNRLKRITLSENNFKILPEMTMIDSDKIIIKEESLNEPFASLYENYKKAKTAGFEQPMRVFFEQLRAIWEMVDLRERRNMVRSKGRNVLTSKLTLTRTNKVPVPLNRLISSFLSGKSEKKSIEKQLDELKSNLYNLEGGRKNKSRKNKINKKGKSRKNRKN